MILHKENITFKQHYIYVLGEYIQAKDEPDRTNTNAPRTLDCIYLRPSNNRQVGYDLLHLQTNKIINRKNMECSSHNSFSRGIWRLYYLNKEKNKGVPAIFNYENI